MLQQNHNELQNGISSLPDVLVIPPVLLGCCHICKILVQTRESRIGSKSRVLLLVTKHMLGNKQPDAQNRQIM
jgi:hypothetical protein